MDRECGCRVLLKLDIFLIRFLEFTIDRKRQLSQKRPFGVGPLVHEGVYRIHSDN